MEITTIIDVLAISLLCYVQSMLIIKIFVRKNADQSLC